MNGMATFASSTDTDVTVTPQHLKALQQANKVRLARAELKRRVASGEMPAADVVLSCPSEAETMTVADLLIAQRRWGRMRSRKVLALIPITEAKQVGTLTQRQALALAAALSPRSSGAKLTACLSEHMTPGNGIAETIQASPSPVIGQAPHPVIVPELTPVPA
jgi:hypothetical protein